MDINSSQTCRASSRYSLEIRLAKFTSKDARNVKACFDAHKKRHGIEQTQQGGLGCTSWPPSVVGRGGSVSCTDAAGLHDVPVHSVCWIDKADF
jgi:hypothetical protein